MRGTTQARIEARGESATRRDDEAIRKTIADNTLAFNHRDVKGLVQHVAQHGDHIGVSGDWTSGRDALERSLTEYFKTPRPTTEDKVEQIRYIAADVAIAIVKRVYQSQTGTRNSVSTYVFHKTQGGWEIEAFQNTFVQ